MNPTPRTNDPFAETAAMALIHLPMPFEPSRRAAVRVSAAMRRPGGEPRALPSLPRRVAPAAPMAPAPTRSTTLPLPARGLLMLGLASLVVVPVSAMALVFARISMGA